jgi:dienelactone hydrolase
MTTTVAPYGTWRSPIASPVLAESGVLLNQLQVAGNKLYWSETRPADNGRSVLVHRAADGTLTDVTPADYSVRSRVHEYGGGAFRIEGDTVYFVNDEDQRLYRQPLGGSPEPLTPEPDSLRALRYADIRISPDGRYLVCIREHHPDEHPLNVVNEIISLNLNTPEQISVIASGYDFYANARFSPDGSQLAYVAWNHPNMPWEDTELWVVPFREDGTVGEGRKVAGEHGESVMQPEWHPDGTLHFISDRTDWWNLYREVDGTIEPIFLVEGEVGYAPWIFDVNRYDFLPDGSIVTAYTQYSLDMVVHIAEGTVSLIENPEFTVYRTLAVAGNTVYAIAAGSHQPSVIVGVDIATRTFTVIHSSLSLAIDPAFISAPIPISFPTTNNQTAYAFYYPPTNPLYHAPEGELPPLLVNVHGGPTGQSKGFLSPAIQFWTSRGFAFVDVNYGGSIGYGRAYRERLRDNWGIVDVEDAINAAQYLIDKGLADPKRVAIRGGSAGGYSTLRAITWKNFFTAGASFFGIGDLETMIRDTHKFESRYLDSLIGAYPAEKARYIDRSPVHTAENITCPVLLLQGLEDKVVPPNQAEDMIAAMQKTGTPYAYIGFEGEGHGFRHGKSIIRSAEAELSFYAQVFHFDPADEIEPLEITNLKQ